MTFKLAIEDLLSGPNTVTLGLPNNHTIKSFLIQESFTVTADASYDTPFDVDLAGKFFESFKGGSMGYDMMQHVLQQRVRSMKQTILSWSSSDRPSFSIDLLFVALNTNDDPREKASWLLEGCLPVKTMTGVLGAPWNYSLNPMKQNQAAGRMIVQIGTWFKAPNQVLLNASFQYSKEVTKRGVPLYVSGNISFKPYQQLYADQMLSYFMPMR